MGLNECGCKGGTENTCQDSLAAVCMEMGVQNSLRECGEKLGKPMNPVLHFAMLKTQKIHIAMHYAILWVIANQDTSICLKRGHVVLMKICIGNKSVKMTLELTKI